MFNIVSKFFNIILIINLFITTGYSQVPDTIEVSYHKSIYLFFKEEVTFDVGSEDIIVKSADKKLIVQSRIENFKETNMIVQSGEKFYMFIVRYSDDIKRMVYDYTGKMVQPEEPVKVKVVGKEVNKTRLPNISLSEVQSDSLMDGQEVIVDSGYLGSEKESITDLSDKKKHIDESNIVYDRSIEELERLKQKRLDSLMLIYKKNCAKVKDKKQNIFDRGMIKSKMVVWATGIYVDSNEFYLRIVYENSSRVNYDIDFEKFTVRNIRRGIKQYAKQIEEVLPLYVSNDQLKIIESGSKRVKIFVLKKFTIDKDRKLHYEIWEVGGERKIGFDLLSKDLLNVTYL